jgi:hypothetical protein
MRHVRLSLAAFTTVAALALAGCGIADFDVDQPIREQRLEGSGVPDPTGGAVPIPLAIDIGSAIDPRDTGPIDSVTLSSLTLAITPTEQPAGDVDDWSFLHSVDVFVSSTREGTRLQRRLIAHVDAPGPVTAIEFDVDGGIDLKPYIDEGSRIESQAHGTQPIDDVTFEGLVVFTVHPL